MGVNNRVDVGAWVSDAASQLKSLRRREKTLGKALHLLKAALALEQVEHAEVAEGYLLCPTKEAIEATAKAIEELNGLLTVAQEDLVEVTYIRHAVQRRLIERNRNGSMPIAG